MKTLFEKMRANRVKLEMARRSQLPQMTYQEAQDWKNREFRCALDRMTSTSLGEQRHPASVYGRNNLSGVPGAAW